MTTDKTLEAKITEVENQIARLDVWDEKGEAELGRLHVQLEGLKKRRSHRVTEPNRTQGGTVARGSYSPAVASEYVSLHGIQGPLSNGGFKSFGEFLSVLGSGLHDDRIMGMRVAASTTMGTQGGAMVPEAFVAEALHPAGEEELIMPLAKKYPMNSGSLNVSSLDALSNAGGVMYGGFTGQWIEEGGEFTDQTPTTTKIKLDRKKLGLFTTASSELVSDSQYEAQLVPALRQAVSDFRDDAFFTGNGVGKPKGILNDAAMITVAKESGQSADTIVVTNLDKMYARIHPRLIRRCKWYVNPTCIPRLLGLVREIGTSGVAVPVMTESSGTFYLYGLPVELTSKLPVLGDAGDILLADVSQYGIGFGREIAIERSEHAKFQTDQIVWRVIWRGDAQGLWKSVFTPRNGDTLSWCVKLADRA